LHENLIVILRVLHIQVYSLFLYYIYILMTNKTISYSYGGLIDLKIVSTFQGFRRKRDEYNRQVKTFKRNVKKHTIILSPIIINTLTLTFVRICIQFIL